MWKLFTLEEVCTATQGVQISKSNQISTAKEGYKRYLYISDFKHDKNLKYVEDIYPKKVVTTNDLIVSNTGSQGEVYRGIEGILSNNLFKVSFDATLMDKDFLFYFLKSPLFIDFQNERTRGSTQPHMGHKNFLATPISLPSLAEQQRIVAKLDAAFAEIDQAISYSEKNVANAERLYSYGIDEIFSPLYNLAQPLGNNSEINYGYTAKASFSEGTHKFLRITDIQDNSVDWNGVPFCNIEDTKLPKMLLHDGDIVFARTGATTGKSFLVENPMDAVFASYLIRVSVDRDILLPRYVMHFFQSETYWLQVKEGISGAAQGGFNASKLAELVVPVVPIEEQQNVIDRLDTLYEQATQLASIYEKKLEQQIALKSAILAQELQSEVA